MSLDYIYFEKDYYPFWEYLNLNEDSTIQEVIKNYKEIDDNEKQNPFIRFAWKLLKDPFYRDCYKKYKSIKILYDSGFFIDQYNDNNEISFDLNFLTTPFDKILNNLENINNHNNKNPYIVLLTTGGFSPIHYRHLEIMNIAKTHLTNNNYNVIGGYISPSHDNYVSQKYNGKAALNVEKRVYLIEKAIENSKWLYVDKWEGYYNKVSINFTDVILRLESYLNYHIKTPNGIKICLVFGSDNAGFARTFIQNGYAICINRNGHNQKFFELKSHINNDRIHFIDYEEKIETSSSLIRNGNMDLLNDEIRNIYPDINKKQFQINNIYAIRNDLKMSLKKSNIKVKNKFINEFKTSFFKNLQDIFNNNISIKEILLDKQYQIAEQLIKNFKDKTLSLDVFIHGDYNLHISRLFELSSAQFKPIKLINRPKSLPIKQQIEVLEPGDYVLIEDDIASGNTLKYLFELLPNNIHIINKFILSRLKQQNYTENFYDIIDLRDFVFGLKDSGLVIKLPNQEVIRVPYVLPYTSPISRSKIPMGKELEFSLWVWQLNKKFYSEIPNNLKLHNMDESFITLMKYIGFKENDNMVDIMDWHVQKIDRVVKNS